MKTFIAALAVIVMLATSAVGKLSSLLLHIPRHLASSFR